MDINVLSVNISEQKGTIKKPVPGITLNETGVVHDAHAGLWHRQVSMLGKESVDRFARQAGRQIAYGEFAENITTEGLELVSTAPLDRFIGEHIELEVTQIGKECHGTSCAIFREVGNCVMPKEGIFARVIKPGVLKPGDMLQYVPRVFRFHVITLSDRASRGEYEDRSGPRIIELLNNHFADKPRQVDITHTIIDDDAERLASLIMHSVIIDQQGKDIQDAPTAAVEYISPIAADVIITTGGTGVGPRDITVDTIQPMLDREIPGIMEMIRIKYGAEKPNALLSRGVAGILGNTFIYTLPGSVRAVNEYMTEILKTLEHLIYMRYGLDSH